MTSQERHEARYKRRKAKRLSKRINKTFDEVINYPNLIHAGRESCNGSRWKTSTKNFERNLLTECQKIYESIKAEQRTFKGFHSFTTIEHGKLRYIDALDIRERTAQKCLCKFLLTETYSRSFIYDNSASLPGKGMDFALNRLKKHIRDHFRKYGLNGWIYQFDLKSYFCSIPHEEIKKRARAKISDNRLYKLFCSYVDDFNEMKHIEYQNCGVGLGSEVSQIIALDYASPIDHYVKDILRVKGYGRYMDDGYLISNDIDFLKYAREQISKLTNKLGININPKKNNITPLHHSFRFLKMRFRVTNTGKVIMRISRKTIFAMRRKLKKFKQWLLTNKMQFEQIAQSYQSWRAHARRCNSYNTLRNMDRYFINLFTDELRNWRMQFKCYYKSYKTNIGWMYRSFI